MSTNEKKGITVKVDAELHTEVRQYLEEHELTMAEFVAQALRDELHPQISAKEDKNMGNMRTMAFQVPEELFQKIKNYLQRNNMTQKQFVIGLIENEIERDLTQRSVEADQRETAAVSEFEGNSEQFEGSNTEEQVESDFEDVSDDVNEDLDNGQSEDEDLNEDESESEEQGMSMGM